MPSTVRLLALSVHCTSVAGRPPLLVSVTLYVVVLPATSVLTLLVFTTLTLAGVVTARRL